MSFCVVVIHRNSLKVINVVKDEIPTVLKSLERKKGRERERRRWSSQFWPGQFWSKSVVELAE